MLTLVRRSAQRIAWTLVSLAAILVTLQIVIVAIAASFEASGSFERLLTLVPGFISRPFAGSLLTLASFSTMSVAGYFHPVVVLIVAQFAIYIATEPAGDVETGIVDLVLARAIPRRALITRSVLVALGATLALVVAMALATWVGLTSLAPAGASWPSARTVGVLSTQLAMVASSTAAVALVVSAYVRRRATAMSGVGLCAVALYLLEFLGASWAPAAPLARISPFHYYEGMSILNGRADLLRDAVVLGAITFAGIAFAYWKFGRRDL